MEYSPVLHYRAFLSSSPMHNSRLGNVNPDPHPPSPKNKHIGNQSAMMMTANSSLTHAECLTIALPNWLSHSISPFSQNKN